MVNSKIVLGIIILLIGIFYTAAPHSVHTSTGLGLGLDHTAHIVLGIILIIIGIIVAWKWK